MQITITLRMNYNGIVKAFDVQVNQKQRIKSSLEIICKSLGLTKDLNQINYIKSTRNNRWISVNDTYEQGDIFTGDILEI